MAAAAILKITKKCRYLCNGFTNFYEIWYDVVDKMKMIPVKDDTVTEN